MNIRRTVTNFDFFMFIAVILLAAIGVLFIYSANITKINFQGKYFSQIIAGVIGLVLFFITTFIPSRTIYSFTKWFYILCILGILLAFLPIFHEVKGQTRTPIQFSEFSKIATILLLSQFYTNVSKEDIQTIKTFLIGMAISFFPVIFIMLQGDLGTSLVFIVIFFAVSYIAGINKKLLLYFFLLIIFVSSIPVITTINKIYYHNENEIFSLFVNLKYLIVIFFLLTMALGIALLIYFDVVKGLHDKFKLFSFWFIFIVSALLIGLIGSYPVNKVLKEYQKDRLLIFFNPYIDEKKSGYNIIQAMTAVGNGGLFGKGWTRGEQVQKSFVPEQDTDFIYPVIAEELGFAGSFFILLLYLTIFYRGVKTIIKSKDFWGAYVVTGILAMLAFHIIENMGMCVGIMPITGIPLPFISYGGSFLLVCFIASGIIMNIEMNKYAN